MGVACITFSCDLGLDMARDQGWLWRTGAVQRGSSPVLHRRHHDGGDGASRRRSLAERPHRVGTDRGRRADDVCRLRCYLLGRGDIDSGLTAILFATLPLITIAAAHVPAGRADHRSSSPELLAFLGVVALFGDRARLDVQQFWPMVAVIAGALLAAIASVATKNTARPCTRRR